MKFSGTNLSMISAILLLSIYSVIAAPIQYSNTGVDCSGMPQMMTEEVFIANFDKQCNQDPECLANRDKEYEEAKDDYVNDFQAAVKNSPFNGCPIEFHAPQQ